MSVTILVVPPFSTLCNAAFALRREVFVWEQKVPEEEEHDADDMTATHFVAIVAGEVVGTLRLIDRSPAPPDALLSPMSGGLRSHCAAPGTIPPGRRRRPASLREPAFSIPPRHFGPERLRLSLRCRTIWAARCSTGKVLHRTARPFQQ